MYLGVVDFRNDLRQNVLAVPALRDIRDHEIVHREFFRAALGSNAIPELEYNFSAVNFGDRTSVLTTAQTF